MKANELRIGNFLQGSPLAIPLIGVQEDGIIAISAHGIDMIERGLLEHYEPIPLTEEWMVKFGFEKIIHQFSMNDGSLNEHWELKKNRYWLVYFGSGRFTINEPKVLHVRFSHNRYVHQLQNLYFALTGEELIYFNK